MLYYWSPEKPIYGGEWPEPPHMWRRAFGDQFDRFWLRLTIWSDRLRFGKALLNALPVL